MIAQAVCPRRGARAVRWSSLRLLIAWGDDEILIVALLDPIQRAVYIGTLEGREFRLVHVAIELHSQAGQVFAPEGGMIIGTG